jgi:hypothetical protein
MITQPTPTLNGSICEHPKRMAFTLEDGRRITVSYKLLTPSEASELLSLNTRNRRLNAKSSDLIAADISDGEWKFTGDTIKIATDADGTRFLADAQHRLEAIIKGGVPVPVLIVENLAPDVTDIIDQGRPRAVGDILRMAYGRTELKNETIIAGISNLLMIGYGKASNPNRREVAEYANAHLDKLTTWASWAVSVSAESDKVQIGPGHMVSAMTSTPLGALAVYMTDQGASYELTTDFLFRISTGRISDSDQTNVIPALRKRQKNGIPLARIGGGAATVTLFTEFSTYINAYNKWVQGEQVAIIKGQKHPVKTFNQLPAVSKLGR